METAKVADACSVTPGLAPGPEAVKLHDPCLGTVVSLCFDYLNSVDAPIAVKVHSMSVIQRVSEHEPDLKRELQTAIELMMPYVGPALQARGRMVIKQLARDQNKGHFRRKS